MSIPPRLQALVYLLTLLLIASPLAVCHEHTEHVSADCTSCLADPAAALPTPAPLVTAHYRATPIAQVVSLQLPPYRGKQNRIRAPPGQFS